MKKILVIGQGIAGTALAIELLRHGAQVEIAEGALPGGASRAAAGIVNPVTGKRFVQSWRVNEFLPFAKNFYQKIGQELGANIWQDLPILRLLASVKEENDWASRCALPDFETFLAPRSDAGDWSGLLREGYYFGEIRQAARVDFQVFIEKMRERWTESGIFRAEKVAPQAIERLLPEFDHLIFCEGAAGATNPFFQNLDWQLAKGEALILKIEDPRAADVAQILKKKIMLAPLGNGRFWAGANYDWDFADGEPTAAGRDFLLEELQAMLAAPFKIERHLAGVRPTLVSRRPVTRLLDNFPKVGVFNGLGTKGALLAPFFAAEFALEILRA